jgi:hypothetical protein
MQLDHIEIHIETGTVGLRFRKSLFDAEGNAVFGGYHRDTVIHGEKDHLTTLLGQSLADAIEASYWN